MCLTEPSVDLRPVDRSALAPPRSDSMKTLAAICLAVSWCAVAAPVQAATSAAPSAVGSEPTEAQRAAYRRPDVMPFPPDNPYTPEKAAPGTMLFFDTRLSRDSNLNCASCHHPSFGWEVPFAIGAGGKPLDRHAPTNLNLAWSRNLFRDGRAPNLEAQARGPIEAPVEIDLPVATAVTRLKAVQGYVAAFDKAFPREGLTEQTLLKAIATYERTLVTGDTPFERWIRSDASALSPQAKRGFALFDGKANCTAGTSPTTGSTTSGSPPRTRAG